MPETLIIGTRGSKLALWQANYVKDLLAEYKVECEIKIIKTKGDQFHNLSFEKIEGKGFFTKEIEDELFNGTIDVAVHSLKDLPTKGIEGLTISAHLKRQDPADVLIINKNATDFSAPISLKKNAVTGTSSARRKSQLIAIRPDLNIETLRGNVPTRINKLRVGLYDAIILAAAGISRLQLDLSEFEVYYFPVNILVPAPAQGVIAVQVRENDERTIEITSKINDENAALTSAIERKILYSFDGGCQMPLGVYITTESIVRVSYSASSERYPIRLAFKYHENNNFESLVEYAKNLSSKSVLITRDESENKFLKRCLEENNYKLTGLTFIEIKEVIPQHLPAYDWIFFSSKNCVIYFLNAFEKIQMNARVGAIGNGTAEFLRLNNIDVDFIAGNNFEESAGKLDEMVDGKTILFPVSNNSLRTIQRYIKNSITIDLIVYQTNYKPSELKENYDIVVFSSPSNVRSFFKLNQISMDQKVIAWGESTGNAIKEYFNGDIIVPFTFDEAGVTEAIFSAHLKL